MTFRDILALFKSFLDAEVDTTQKGNVLIQSFIEPLSETWQLANFVSLHVSIVADFI